MPTGLAPSVLRRRLALVLCSAMLLSGLATVGFRAPAHAATVPFDPILSGAPIEGYAHNPQAEVGYAGSICYGRLREGTAAAYNYIDSLFSWASPGTLYACREMINDDCDGTVVDPIANPNFYSTCWSNHAQGRALDVMVGGYAPAPGPLMNGNSLLDWLLAVDAQGNRQARARRLGVQQILWNNRCWLSTNSGDRTVTTASNLRICGSDHLNHVHLDLTLAGADGLTSAYTGSTANARESDYNGDRRSDMMVYRPSEGNWYVRYAGGGQAMPLNNGRWGDPGDIPLNGDYDGDGKADMMIFRPDTGQWLVKYTATGNNAILTSQWGGWADTALDGDYNGDGKADMMVYRPIEGNWYVRYTGGGQALLNNGLQWGDPGDVPLVGDYDGDAKDDMIIFRPSTGQWLVKYTGSGNNETLTSQWGGSTDVVLTGDYNGDRKSDMMVYRPSEGNWYVRYTGGGQALLNNGLRWGDPGDVPLVGDYDGDAKDDMIIFRPSTGQWLVKYTGSGNNETLTSQWGGPGDIVM